MKSEVFFIINMKFEKGVAFEYNDRIVEKIELSSCGDTMAKKETGIA